MVKKEKDGPTGEQPTDADAKLALIKADKAAKNAAYAKFIRSNDSTPGARTQKVPPEIGLKIKEGGPRSVKVWFEQYVKGGCDWAQVCINIMASFKSYLETLKKKGYKTEAQMLEFYKDPEVVEAVKAEKKAKGEWKPCPDAPSCDKAILYNIGLEDTVTEGTRNETEMQVTLSAAIDHVVAQSLLDSFQPATSLMPAGAPVHHNDMDQARRLEAEKLKKKEAADAARKAKAELATSKCAVYRHRMMRDLGGIEVYLREVEATQVNKETKREFVKRFSKHRHALQKYADKMDAAVRAEDNNRCTALVNECDQDHVLPLKDTIKAWKAMKKAVVL